MTPTAKDFARCLATLRAMIAFFPTADDATAILLDELRSMIATTEQLEWFTRAAVRRFERWGADCSLPALRALYCTRYEPADGDPPTIHLPGYSSEELEARARERERREDEARLESYRRLAALQHADHAPLQLTGELKSISPPPPERKGPIVIERAPARSAEEHARRVAELERELHRRKNAG